MIWPLRSKHAPRFLLALALGAPSCAGTGEPVNVEIDAPTAAPDGPLVGTFVARVSPKKGTFEILPTSKAPRPPALAPQSLDELTIDVDDVPDTTNGNITNVVELVTNSTDICPAGYSSTDFFCASVTTRSFFNTRGLSNVHLYIAKLTDADGNDTTAYAGQNSDPSFSALNNTLGLWKYTGTNVATRGVLAARTATNQGGNAGTRDLVFARGDGGDFYAYFYVYATLTYSGYTMSPLSTALPAITNACTQGGSKRITSTGGLSMLQLNLPFPFTFYGTNYALGAANSKLTVSRFGALGFGALSTATGSAYNTGASVALPSTSATTFKPGIYPFWENLNYTTTNATVTTSPSAFCTLTAGSEPNRQLVLTWHDMKYTGETSAVYPLSPAMTISAILHEGSDVIDFIYGVMTDLPVTRANGAVAVVGVQNEAGTVATAKNMIANSVAANSMYTLTPMP